MRGVCVRGVCACGVRVRGVCACEVCACEVCVCACKECMNVCVSLVPRRSATTERLGTSLVYVCVHVWMCMHTTI